MFCTSCLVEVSSTKHYITELHSHNVKLKINSIPPVTYLPINTPIIEQVKEINYYRHSIPNLISCVFCDYESDCLSEHILSHLQWNELFSLEHLNEMNLRYKQLKCIFCARQFGDKIKLKAHIKKYSNYKKELQLTEGRAVRKDDVHERIKVRRPVENVKYVIMKGEAPRIEHVKNIEMKDKLKISLAMNHQKHFRAHWLQ